MKGDIDRFPVDFEFDNGHRKRFRTIVCSCGHVGRMPDHASGTILAISLVARRFREDGWEVGRRPRQDRCPNCVKARHQRRISERQSRAETIDLPTPEPAEEPMPTNSPVAALPPRTPTAANRRAILDALETRYITTKGLYEGDWSDEKLAVELDYPKAWIAELRELIHGGPDTNEASAKKASAITDMEARIALLEKRIEQDFASAIDGVSALKADLARIKR